MRRGWLVIGLLAALGALATVISLPTQAQQTPEEPASIVRVRGEGLVLASPDVARINLGATVQRETPSAAFGEAQMQAAELVQRLQAQGVAANDIQTTNISLSPVASQATAERPSQIVGWRATYNFSARVRDFTRIPAILEDAIALLGSGAQIQGISFSIQDTDALISQARAEAFENAQAAATELARLAGARLGEVISIEETVTPPPTPVQAGQPAPAATPRPATPTPGDALASQVAPGQLSVRVSLSVVFALERGPGT